MSKGENYIEKLGFAIGAPTLLLTEKSKRKSVRVLGVLGMFVLFPLLFIGMFIIGISMVVGMIEEI